MLFSGGGSKTKKEDKKERKSDRDEKYEIQENVFMRWANSLLANDPIKDFKDLGDIKYITPIVQLVTGNSLPLAGNRVDDCHAILQTLADLKTVPQELVDYQQKAVLSLWWTIINKFWRQFAPKPVGDEKLMEAIKTWCLEATRGSNLVTVSDFTSSWRDGHAFNVLLHSIQSDLVDFSKVAEMSAIERLDSAFAIAEAHFRTARLLLPKELHSEHLDSRSVVCYLMTLYLSISGTNKEEMDTVQSPLIQPSTSHSVEESLPPPVPPHASSHHSHLPASGLSPPGTPLHGSSMPQGQYPVDEEQQSLLQQQIQLIQTQHTPLAATTSGGSESRTVQKSDKNGDLENAEVRSRKSSSSSHKSSSKSKKTRKEELAAEFETALEQVLAWLLEAEEELATLTEKQRTELSAVRSQFNDFEQFMASLTDSQDTVGKVLHRGQVLCSKADSDEEKEAIQKQLQVVNTQWEELRALAMDRQTALQTQLNSLQTWELRQVEEWLTETERMEDEAPALACTRDEALHQIEQYQQLQNRIDAFQERIDSLSTFVAVVDEGDVNDEAVATLEIALQSVGNRWQKVCEWAEKRAAKLDGLAELCEQTDGEFGKLSDWLKAREHDLLGLKSAHHLEDAEQVAEQVHKLQKCESALETEHGSFVRLSQLSCELVARLDDSNGEAANAVRRRLDTVTQRWDNLVARIEEHSKTLVRSGKADLKQFKDRRGAVEEPLRKVQRIGKEEGGLSSEVTSETTDTEKEKEQDEAKEKLLSRFIEHIGLLDEELKPLQRWSETFTVVKKPDQTRRMISICQEKLLEIKEQETRVNRLQLELEHMHMAGLNSKQLKKANDAFEVFAKGWARIVTKISEAMNVLTGQAEGDEESVVANKIEQWIEGCDKVLSDLQKVPPHEREKRLAKLEEQLNVQSKNLNFIEKDPLKKAILKKGLEIARKKLETLKPKNEPGAGTSKGSEAEARILAELESKWSCVGDVEGLRNDIKRTEKLVDEARKRDMPVEVIEKVETRRAEVEERHRVTNAAASKIGIAEESLSKIEIELEDIGKDSRELREVISFLEGTRKRLTANETERKEAERAAEKMLTLEDTVPEKIVHETRARIRGLAEKSKSLETKIDDELSCARKEHKRTLTKTIGEEDRLLEQLQQSVEASEKAADAEECCEHLDALENLLEEVTQKSSSIERALAEMDDSFARENVARLSSNREKIAAKARDRIIALEKGVKECEKFERSMAELQKWASHMGPLLTSRRAADVTALDVPQEYRTPLDSESRVQEISKEFKHWEDTLDELNKWLNEGERRDNERLRAQFEHAKMTFTDLQSKFNEFKQPKTFEEKLERTNAKLNAIENSIDELTGIKASDAGDGTAMARKLARDLKETDEELQSLMQGNEKLKEEGIVDKAVARENMQRIKDLRRNTKELGIRAEEAVERLEDCSEMWKRIREEAVEMDEWLQGMEKRLSEFEREEATVDEGTIEKMMAEWNRNEAAIKNIDHLETTLKEKGVTLESVYMERRQRADALKRRLDNWNVTQREMEEDEDELLVQVDQLHNRISKQLNKLEEKPVDEIAKTLSLLRNDRDRLSSRSRRLAAKNPRLAKTKAVEEISKKWKELEGKLHEATPIFTPPSADLDESSPFAEKVAQLSNKFTSASRLLDFDSSPVESVSSYKQRISAVEAFLASSRPVLEKILKEGRRLADSGRMELSTHRAIEQLDEIADQVDRLEEQCETHNDRADTLEQQEEALKADIGRVNDVLNALLARDLKESNIAEATRKDLLERDSQLTDISQRAAHIHQQLPGKSPMTRDNALDNINEKLILLEEKLAKTETDRHTATEGAAAAAARPSPDRASLGSAPLAMEAYGTGSTTEDETMRFESPLAAKRSRAPEHSETSAITSTTSPVPALRHQKPNRAASSEEETLLQVSKIAPIETTHDENMTESMGIDPIEKVYADLDEIEEFIQYNEEFPMENVNDVVGKFETMKNTLKEAERKVAENEMTLDMLQVEHTRERIDSLDRDIKARLERNKQHRREWAESVTSFEDAERGVAEAERVEKEMQAAVEDRGGARRNKMDELDKIMKRCEEGVCNAVRHQAAILTRLEEGGPTAEELKTRVHAIEERYREVLKRMREEKQREEAERVDEHELRKAVQDVAKWCDQMNKLVRLSPNPLDPTGIEEAYSDIAHGQEEVVTRKNQMVSLEAAKDVFIQQSDVSKEAKHEMRRNVSEVAKRVADIRSDLGDRRTRIEKQRSECTTFWAELEAISKKTVGMNRAMDRMQDALLYTPASVPAVKEEAEALKEDVDDVKRKVKQANERHAKLGGKSARRVVEVLTQAAAAIARAINLREPEHQFVESDSQSKSQSTVIDMITDRRSTAHENGSRLSAFTDEDTLEGQSAEDEVMEEIGRLHSESLTNESALPSTAEHAHHEHQLSARDEAHNQLLTHMKHWLAEMERDAGLTVDLAESQQIREMAHQVHNISEQIKRKIGEVVAVEDSTADRTVKEKAHELAETMQRVLLQCERRRNMLNVMAAETRQSETDRAEMELWMREAEQIVAGAETAGGRQQATAASAVEAVREELQAVERIITELDERKVIMASINAKGNQLLDNYSKDEAHNLSHQLSRLNMRWTKFNDTIRVRRAVLDASLRSRSDFHTALLEFEEWLARMRDDVDRLEDETANLQAMKDTARRKDCMQQSRTIAAELNAHEKVYKAVDDMGKKLVSGFESNKERNEMQSRIDRLNQNWHGIKESSRVISERLEKAEQEWEKLTDTLAGLNEWLEDRSAQIVAQQPIGGSLSAVMQQSNWIKQTQRDMEAKAPLVKETITAAHSYLMQHDLRPKMHRPAVLDEDDREDALDAEQRRCGLQIHADSEKLKEAWAELNKQIAEWDRLVQEAALKLQELERALAECQLHLSAVEGDLEQMRAVEKLRLEELKDARVETEEIAKKVDTVRLHVDDANDSCGRLLAADMRLDSHTRNQIDAVNHRFHILKTSLRVRAAALRNALTDFGPSSEHFLNQSVELPWQRAISKTNQLPYYIDHTTERTQWEHPVWVEMCKELSQFNRVKFIAYRTAMKLRALQKRLCLDLANIEMLDKAFHRLVGLSPEEAPSLEDMVSCLLPLFEQIHLKHPQLVRSVALAVDLCINFILNLFDPTRDGVLRLLSFKIALVVFCNSELEEKYKYLFDLVAQQGHANQKQIALLLYDLIHIPRLVGEAAAFGGSNVEPSVRSCFESVRMAQNLSSAAFLDWLKKEPQSIVWLPVMHRLATAEFAKHQAKCNVCKMFPIIGLRYRCLYCFNLDLCQNCFFSQRTAKKHKLKHAMQEYATPTTSSEDARDFAKMVRNKLRRSKNSLGYLPVDVAEEGLPIVSAPRVRQNPATEPLHARTAVMSSRLAELTVNQVAEPRDEPTTAAGSSDIKSPLQIINQVEQMQKDELDQLLHRLQLENMELKMELERKKSAAISTPDLDKAPNGAAGGRRSEGRGATLPRLSNTPHGRSVPSLKSTHSQYDVLDEARALRLHKQRLEHRSRILEQQNQQLELQLQRLKRVIDAQKNGSPHGEIQWNGNREWELERHSQPPLERTAFSPVYAAQGILPDPNLPLTPDWEDDSAAVRSTRMQSLLATVDDLGKAMENLVVSVCYDSDKE